MSLDAARQREKEAEKAAIARKRRKAAMEREYNKIYKDCYKDKCELFEAYLETLDKTLVSGRKSMGLEICTMAGLDTESRECSLLQTQASFLRTTLHISFQNYVWGGVSNDYQTLKDGTMLARASSKIKLTRATMVSSLKRLIVAEVSSSMLHTVLRTNNGAIMSFGVGRSGQLGHGNNLDVDFSKK